MMPHICGLDHAGRVGAARTLLEAGANPVGCCCCSGGRGDEWLSPLQLAAWRGHPGTVELLVEHAAYPDCPAVGDGAGRCAAAGCSATAAFGPPAAGGPPSVCAAHAGPADRPLCAWSPYLLAADALHRQPPRLADPFAALAALAGGGGAADPLDAAGLARAAGRAGLRLTAAESGVLLAVGESSVISLTSPLHPWL